MLLLLFKVNTDNYQQRIQSPAAIFLVAKNNCLPIFRGFLLPWKLWIIYYTQDTIFSKQLLNANLMFKLKNERW